MAAELHGTIWQHQQMINRRGYCWWGWWRAQSERDLETDPSAALAEMVGRGRFYLGLFSKSLGRAYVARVEQVVTNHGAPLLTPERDATPSYYTSEAFPAWFKMTEIHRIDGAEITRHSEVIPAESRSQIELLEDLFRDDIEVTERTLIWLDDDIETSLPTIEQIQGNRVLHLSDLHFGDHHEWQSGVTSHPASLTLANAIERTLLAQKVDPSSIGVVVVSGDISDQGPDDARYSDALDFFRRLFAMTNLSSRHLVILPGNHDVTRHVLEEGEEPYDFSQRQYDDRLRQAEGPYRAFCDDLFGSPSVISRIRRFESGEAQLNFLQLNSTLPRDQLTKEYGFLGLAPLGQLDHLLRLYENAISEGRTAVSIAVQHHHVMSTVTSEHVPLPRGSGSPEPVSMMVDQSNLIDWATQYRLRLILHGHQHKVKCRVVCDRFSNNGELYMTDVIGAGSAGATWRPDNEAMSFNLYDVGSDQIRFRALGMNRQMTVVPPLRDLLLPTRGEVPAR